MRRGGGGDKGRKDEGKEKKEGSSQGEKGREKHGRLASFLKI